MKTYLLPWAAGAMIPPGVAHGATNYVTVAGGGDGSSWLSPETLEPALSPATPGDEIWIAQGAYTGNTFTVSVENARFISASGVESTEFRGAARKGRRVRVRIG